MFNLSDQTIQPLGEAAHLDDLGVELSLLTLLGLQGLVLVHDVTP